MTITRLLPLIAVAMVSMATVAQSKLSPQARHLLSKSPSTRMVTGQMAPAYITLHPGASTADLAALGVRVGRRHGDVLTAGIPLALLDSVAALPSVAYVQTGTQAKAMMDVARGAGHADRVQAGEGLSTAFNGSGVVVGIIDSGFDYTHPNFYDAQRNALRIKRVWEQGYDGGSAPQPYGYGTELTTPEAILAAAGDVSTNSHGTHVAGIATGADTSLGDYHGIAPGADIVLVSISGADTETNVNISDAIDYIYSYADSVGKPCVVNMSLGTQIGPHDGTSTFDVLADAMQGPGRLLVGSMGNFGGKNFHAAKYFSGEQADTLRTFVDFKNGLSASTAGGTIDIWGEPGMQMQVNVFTYRPFVGSVVDTATIMLPASTAPARTISLSGTMGTIGAYGEVCPLNDRPHVMLTSDVTALRGNYRLGFEVISSSEGRVNVWADCNNLGLTSHDTPGWTEGDDQCSPAEIGGTGRQVITVGAYVTRSDFSTENSGDMALEETVGGLASFSCVGPTADGRTKPDVAAPGCAIISSASSVYSGISSLPIAGWYEWNNRNYYYAYMQGTSMSAPYVTGVLATWLEANPQLSPGDVRHILSATCVADDFTGTVPAGGSNAWGHGKIDAWAGIVEAISMATDISDTTTPQRALSIAANGRSLYITTPYDGNVSVSVYGLDGRLRTAQTASQSVPGVHTITLATLPQGTYIVKATSAHHSATAKVVVKGSE